MRLTFESVDIVKWIVHPNVGGSHLILWGLNRTKGRERWNSSLFLPACLLIWDIDLLALHWVYIISFLGLRSADSDWNYTTVSPAWRQQMVNFCAFVIKRTISSWSISFIYIFCGFCFSGELWLIPTWNLKNIFRWKKNVTYTVRFHIYKKVKTTQN